MCKLLGSCTLLWIVLSICAQANPPITGNAASQIIRVAVDGTSDDPSCGANWDTACDLQYALTVRASAGDELWVKAGTYFPTSDDDPSISFDIKDGFQVFGGFAGDEINKEERDWQNSPTILSGDLGADHSYHVVRSTQSGSDTALDGFTISFGEADGGEICPGNSCGGGMLNNYSNILVSNVLFKGNLASDSGGAIVNLNGSPTFTDVIINENDAGGVGGGIYNNKSNPTFSNMVIAENSGQHGGGVFNNESNPIFENVTFIDNRTTATDGAGYGGAIYNDYLGNPILNNVSFNKNIADRGGAIYSRNNSLVIMNGTFISNQARSYAAVLSAYNSNVLFINVSTNGNQGNGVYGGFLKSGGSLTIKNSILWDEFQSGELYGYETDPTVQISFSIVRGGWVGSNLISDPLFGVPGEYGGLTHVIPVLIGSPAIDAIPINDCHLQNGSPLKTDQRGVQRPQGLGCDMGAYEFVDNWTLKTYLSLISR